MSEDTMTRTARMPPGTRVLRSEQIEGDKLIPKADEIRALAAQILSADPGAEIDYAVELAWEIATSAAENYIKKADELSEKIRRGLGT